jgi:ribosomal protein S18 acetylase RimI-like enzyme
VTGPFLIEPLAGAHDRRTFDCGNAALDRYFREQVTQDIRRRITHCFVALDPEARLAGYYTLSAASLPITALSADKVKRLPRYPLLPAGLIGRLAVDRKFRGQGLGGALIVDAIDRAMRAEPAIFTLIVEAKDDGAASFYRHYGFRPLASRPLSFFLPLAEATRQLKTR